MQVLLQNRGCSWRHTANRLAKLVLQAYLLQTDRGRAPREQESAATSRLFHASCMSDGSSNAGTVQGKISHWPAPTCMAGATHPVILPHQCGSSNRATHQAGTTPEGEQSGKGGAASSKPVVRSQLIPQAILAPIGYRVSRSRNIKKLSASFILLLVTPPKEVGSRMT